MSRDLQGNNACGRFPASAVTRGVKNYGGCDFAGEMRGRTAFIARVRRDSYASTPILLRWHFLENVENSAIHDQSADHSRAEIILWLRASRRCVGAEVTSLITPCLGCDVGQAARPVRRARLTRCCDGSRSRLDRRHPRDLTIDSASSIERARRSALTPVSPGSMEAPRRGRPARGKRAQAQLLRRHVTTLVLTSGEAAERGPKAQKIGRKKQARPRIRLEST